MSQAPTPQTLRKTSLRPPQKQQSDPIRTIQLQQLQNLRDTAAIIIDL